MNMTTSGETCSCCGRPADRDHRHVRFTLPDPVLGLPRKEKTRGTWMSHAGARESVMMQVPEAGAFVRATLPVRLTGGRSLTFGVWLAVDPRELKSIFAVWWEPEYQDLKVNGWLANPIPPWGLLAAPVAAVVRDPRETPCCDRSGHPELERVLRDEWPAETVLGAVNQAADQAADQAAS